MRCREIFTLLGGGTACCGGDSRKQTAFRVLPGNHLHNVFEGISRPAPPMPGSLKTSTRHAMDRWRNPITGIRKPSIGTSPARKGAKLAGAAATARSSSSAVEIGECNEESDPGVVFNFDIAVADRLGAHNEK